MKYMIVGLSDEVIEKVGGFISMVKLTEGSIERPTEILAALIAAGMNGGKETLTLEHLPDNLLRD